MTDHNNNLPIIAEELIIENKIDKSTQTQLQSSDILKTKQLIPHNFVQLETKGKNYMCSTKGWKEPVCERHGFTYENKWIQLDIPHELIKKLELKKGENIIYPVYINSELINKELEFGGITLEKEDEVFLLKPLTSKKEVQTELTGKKINELEERVNEQIKKNEEFIANNDELRRELATVKQEKQKLQNQIANKDNQINTLQDQINNPTWIDNYLNRNRNYRGKNFGFWYADNDTDYPNIITLHSSFHTTLITDYKILNEDKNGLDETQKRVFKRLILDEIIKL